MVGVAGSSAGPQLIADPLDGRIMTEIFVFMPEEGVDVWRPVDAEAVGPCLFRIVSPDPDPEDEVWEFKSGDVVRCEERALAGGRRLVAVSKRDRSV